MVKGIKRLFIDNVEARKFRRQIRHHDRGNPRVEAGEAMQNSKQPGWAKAFWDDLSKSPTDFAESFMKSLK